MEYLILSLVIVGLYVLYKIVRFLIRAWTDPANQLGVEAAKLGWNAVGRRKDVFNGTKNVIYKKGNTLAEVSWKDKNVKASGPVVSGEFKNFEELERALQSAESLPTTKNLCKFLSELSNTETQNGGQCRTPDGYDDEEEDDVANDDNFFHKFFDIAVHRTIEFMGQNSFGPQAEIPKTLAAIKIVFAACYIAKCQSGDKYQCSWNSFVSATEYRMLDVRDDKYTFHDDAEKTSFVSFATQYREELEEIQISSKAAVTELLISNIAKSITSETASTFEKYFDELVSYAKTNILPKLY